MKNYLVLLFITSLVFISCERETGSEEAINEMEISNLTISTNSDEIKELTESGMEYLESEFFRDQLNELGIIDLDTFEFDLNVVISQQEVSIIAPQGDPISPQGRIIRWSINESYPGVPAGMYFLDTCTGQLTNAIGRHMGTLAGVWGNAWYNDCD